MKSPLKLLLVLFVLVTLVAGFFMLEEEPGTQSPSSPDLVIELDATTPVAELVSHGERDVLGKETSLVEAVVAGDVSPAQPTETPEPGTIVVEVRRGSKPLANSMLHFRATGRDHWIARDPWSDPEVQHASLDVAGRALLRGLAVGEYTLAVELGPNDLRQKTVTLRETDGVLIVIQLGECTLFGTVWDGDGTPVSGALVGASAGGWQSVFEATALTDDKGRYRIEALPSGITGVSIRKSGSAYGNFDASELLTLVEGEQRRYDLGSSGGLETPRERLATWSGRLLTRSGEPILGGGSLHLHGDANSFAQADLGQDGSFEVQLKTDVYKVTAKLGLRGPRLTVAEDMLVSSEGLSVDLVYPGARVVLTVRNESTGDLVPAELLRQLWPGARIEGRTDSNALRGGWVVFDGIVHIDGLGTGNWIVQCNGATAPVNLIVIDSDLQLAVELFVSE